MSNTVNITLTKGLTWSRVLSRSELFRTVDIYDGILKKELEELTDNDDIWGSRLGKGRIVMISDKNIRISFNCESRHVEAQYLRLCQAILRYIDNEYTFTYDRYPLCHITATNEKGELFVDKKISVARLIGNAKFDTSQIDSLVIETKLDEDLSWAIQESKYITCGVKINKFNPIEDTSRAFKDTLYYKSIIEYMGTDLLNNLYIYNDPYFGSRTFKIILTFDKNNMPEIVDNRPDLVSDLLMKSVLSSLIDSIGYQTRKPRIKYKAKTTFQKNAFLNKTSGYSNLVYHNVGYVYLNNKKQEELKL